jgi:beta-galactosidase
MEQQPGPVNWAPYNPAPQPGMVRAWSWEALAHGADVVSYFRWRQVPFAQEQMHAALLLPDSSETAAAAEVQQVAREIADLGLLPPCAQAPVALVVSYESAWITDIQPQGRDFRWLRFAMALYTAARALGLDVDLVPAGASLAGYRLVLVPPLLHLDEACLASLRELTVPVLLAPRTGSKTEDFQIPATLPPGPLQALLPLQIVAVESLRPGITARVNIGEEEFSARSWRETVRTALTPLASFGDGGGAWYAQGGFHYLACWPDSHLLTRIVSALALQAGLAPQTLAEGVRLQRRGDVTFAINFSTDTHKTPAPADAVFVLGSRQLPPAGVAAWREH